MKRCPNATPPHCNRHHLNCDKCLEDKTKREGFRTRPSVVLCIYHNNHQLITYRRPQTAEPSQSPDAVSDEDVRKRLFEKPRFELAAKGVFRLYTVISTSGGMADPGVGGPGTLPH